MLDQPDEARPCRALQDRVPDNQGATGKTCCMGSRSASKLSIHFYEVLDLGLKGDVRINLLV